MAETFQAPLFLHPPYSVGTHPSLSSPDRGPAEEMNYQRKTVLWFAGTLIHREKGDVRTVNYVQVYGYRQSKNYQDEEGRPVADVEKIPESDKAGVKEALRAKRGVEDPINFS